ncbi:MAG: YbhB/YbcL family Raf kinase inhibitor-like protein [Burkholderiales bacterium]|nr:YbhB/YbcL family Raf kinase inhibitor-like protein [Burkholderiales bacterium]
MESIFRVWSDSFPDGQRIPEGFAFAKISSTPGEHTVPAGNRNPQIAWSNAPAGTKSLILLCTDHDVPADFSAANKEGCTIPADAPRTDFHHWILVDISPEESCIDPGTLSKGFVPHGKKGPACANGMRQGLNDYTQAFADDPEMRGKYYGYDGPCPPWNDLRPHGYVFTVYAVDFPLLPLSGPFTAEDVLEAMKGHILASGSVTGMYSLNPEVAHKL